MGVMCGQGEATAPEPPGVFPMYFPQGVLAFHHSEMAT